jgi:hypothetical protein
MGSTVRGPQDHRRHCLRVCPETLGWIAEFSEHEADGGNAQECECLAIEVAPPASQSYRAFSNG